jgi:hypothetical protein
MTAYLEMKSRSRSSGILDLALVADQSLSPDSLLLLLPGTTKWVQQSQEISQSQMVELIATFNTDSLNLFSPLDLISPQATGSLGRYFWVQVGSGMVSTRIASLISPTTTT